jgi:hypothetical protein
MSVVRDVEWIGDRISIREDGRVVASGRWGGGHIVDRSGAIGDGSAEAWEALETELRQESEAQIRATTDGAYDERGVDVTQIDRMLSLSPLERLQALDAQRRSIARLVGHGPRD